MTVEVNSSPPGLPADDSHDQQQFLRRAAVLPTTDEYPLALIDEIGYLDAVWQAPLAVRCCAGRVAGLTLTCSTPVDFDSLMNALYDALNRVDVPLSDETRPS